MALQQNNVNFTPVSTEGLDDVFALAPGPGPVTGHKEPVREPVTGAEGVPVEDAALLLGTSVNALKKRLRKGTVRGTKVETKHGEKWFVDSSELNGLAPVTQPKAHDAAPVTGADAPVPEPVTSAIEPVPVDVEIQGFDLALRVQELERKLEGATYRNGYLEAENEGLRLLLGAQEAQIKLLTDSQHKSGWWSRFSAWFGR